MVPEVGLEPTRCYPLDFESSASAIPPLRHVRNINYYTQTLQSCQYTFTNYFYFLIYKTTHYLIDLFFVSI